MNLRENELDDLTEIKGIGPARQRWFNKSLGVFTFRDLAALSADKIESRLKADKQIVSRGIIESWIAEAQVRAGPAKTAQKKSAIYNKVEPEQLASNTVEENKPPHEPVDIKNGDDEKGKPVPRNGGWIPFASFVVEFQERLIENSTIEYRTSAHHMEEDKNQEWPGIERDKHCQWMFDQLGDWVSAEPHVEVEKAEPPAKKAFAKPIPIAKSPTIVEITQIHAYQPPQSSTPVVSGLAGQAIVGKLNANQPFALEIQFNLLGEAAIDLTNQQAIYRVRSYFQDQFTGESTELDIPEPGRLVKGELSYTGKLHEIALPTGKYHLYSIVNIQAALVTPDFVIFPEINVVRS